MKKRISFLLIVSMLLMLLSPLSQAAGVTLGELELSQYSYAPSENCRLYIYLPVLSGSGDCTVTVYTASGVAVAQFSRDNLTRNVHTFIWDARPAYGNPAGYDSTSFVPDGRYQIEAVCGGESRSVSVSIAPYEMPAQPEQGIPNYTGDHEVDFMVEQILATIPMNGLSTLEKIQAIYAWVQGNCYRNGDAHEPFIDAMVYAADINRAGEYFDALHAQGEINYDVWDNLYTYNAKKILATRVGTCLEFSALFQVMIAHIGVECWLGGGYFHNSDGSSVIHKWNYLRIDDTYYWSDVRIDNASYERSGRTKLYYDYFLEEDTELWAERHSWEPGEFPVLDTLTPPMADMPVIPQNPLPEEPTDSDDSPDWMDDDPVWNDDFYEDDAAGDYRYPLLQLTDLSDKKAASNAAPVYIDGHRYELESYTIDGYNYFKLRDLALLLSGTLSEFNVVWLADEGAIGLKTGESYLPVGTEFAPVTGATKTAEPSPCQIYIDGKPLSLAAYLIDSSNYFRLRDIGIVFNFMVSWDAEAGAIRVNTAQMYWE